MNGKLLLLPNLLDETLELESFIPKGVTAAVRSIQGLIAESEKGARRYLRKFLTHDEMVKIPLLSLNEHSTEKEIKECLIPLKRGEIWGLISDAGLPCIADPGAEVVRHAHELNIPIETFVGPSSILMALQLSGFSGQRFSFRGYLPREMAELEKEVRELEKRAHLETQIWIEAPYRSAKMLDLLKRILHPSTHLCVAVNLTMPSQRVVSQKVSLWNASPFLLEKEPAVFLMTNF